MLTSISTHAEEFFEGCEVKELLVMSVNFEDGKAIIKCGGDEAEIGIGDAVGVDKWTVTEIEKSYVTIQLDNRSTRIPVKYGFGKSNS